MSSDKTTVEKIKSDFDHRKTVVEQEAHDARESKRKERVKRVGDKGKNVNRGDLDAVDPEEAKL